MTCGECQIIPLVFKRCILLRGTHGTVIFLPLLQLLRSVCLRLSAKCAAGGFAAKQHAPKTKCDHSVIGQPQLKISGIDRGKNSLLNKSTVLQK
jgi:hypothetical protein